MTASSSTRRLEVLVAPVITFLAVITLLFIARIYDQLPVKAPDCRMKTSLGIPCLTCGGTRSMQALAAGDLGQACRFNPSVVLGVFASAIWLGFGIRSYRKGDEPLAIPEQNRRIRNGALIILGVLLINWVYLILFTE